MLQITSQLQRQTLREVSPPAQPTVLSETSHRWPSPKRREAPATPRTTFPAPTRCPGSPVPSRSIYGYQRLHFSEALAGVALPPKKRLCCSDEAANSRLLRRPVPVRLKRAREPSPDSLTSPPDSPLLRPSSASSGFYDLDSGSESHSGSGRLGVRQISLPTVHNITVSPLKSVLARCQSQPCCAGPPRARKRRRERPSIDLFKYNHLTDEDSNDSVDSLPFGGQNVAMSNRYFLSASDGLKTIVGSPATSAFEMRDGTDSGCSDSDGDDDSPPRITSYVGPPCFSEDLLDVDLIELN